MKEPPPRELVPDLTELFSDSDPAVASAAKEAVKRLEGKSAGS